MLWLSGLVEVIETGVTVTLSHACLPPFRFQSNSYSKSLLTHPQLEHPETVGDDNDGDTDDGCTA